MPTNTSKPHFFNFLSLETTLFQLSVPFINPPALSRPHHDLRNSAPTKRVSSGEAHHG